MKIDTIITGATGVIGIALIKKCIKEELNVAVLVNPDSSRTSGIPESPFVKIIKCSVNEYGAIAGKLLEDDSYEGSVFYHLAWKGTYGNIRNDRDIQEKNIEYTLEAVRLAARLKCRTFVGVGSQAEYGRVQGILKADTLTNPENEYGKAKLKAGNESRKLCCELGIKHVWARVLSIYGPHDGSRTMIMSTIGKLLLGEKPSLTKGEQMWDYLYADDAGEAVYLIGQKGIDGHIYPIGSGKARALKEYIEIMRNTIDPSLELGFGEVEYSDKQVMYLCADISELVKDTGFAVRTSFEEGIAKTIEYVRNESAKGD